MNWISDVVRPKIKTLFKREVPENLWIKCPETGQMVFHKDVEANHFVIPGSNFHLRMSMEARLKLMFDGEEWEEIAVPEMPADPLKFRDNKRYVDRLREARAKTNLKEAVKIAVGTVEDLPVTVGVQDFEFIAGSLGMQEGEAVITGMETA